MPLQEGKHITYCFSVEKGKIVSKTIYYLNTGIRSYGNEIYIFFLHLLTLKSSFKQKKSFRVVQLLRNSVSTLSAKCIGFLIQNEWWTLRIKENALKYAWILNTVTYGGSQFPAFGYAETKKSFEKWCLCFWS